MKCDNCEPKSDTEFPPNYEKYVGVRSKFNPGNFLDLHLLAHRIKPTLLEGIEVDYNHRLSSNKSIIVNCVWSHTKPSGCRLGGIYTANMHGNVMKTPIIRADINPSTLCANIGVRYYPLRCCRIETELQKAALDDVPLKIQTCLELCTNGNTLTANFYDVSRNRGRATMSFLRSISDHCALGSELLLEWTEPNVMMADIAVAARYKRHAYSIAGTASRQGIDVSYWQRLHDRLQLATLWAWRRKTDQSIGTICYQLDFEDAHMRGLLDSNLSMGFMYTRYLQQVPVSLAFSLFLSLHTNRFIFGLKLILDPSGLQRGP